MATITFLKRGDSKNIGSLGSVIAYCSQEKKTAYENGRLISAINCLPETALKDFVSTKERFNKTDGRQFCYAIQSFGDGVKLDPVLAHSIAREWAERCYPDHEIFIATHLDTDNIHSHIVINSVNCVNGKKIHQNGDDIKRMRSINDEICMKYDLPICSPKQKQKVKPTTAGEYYSVKGGYSWKRNMMIAIIDTMKKASSREEFIKLMKRRGYEVKWSDTRKNITFIESKNPKHRCGDDNLHYEKFRKENIEYELQLRRAYSSNGEYVQSGAETHIKSGVRSVDDLNRHGQVERADQGSEIPGKTDGGSGERRSGHTGQRRSGTISGRTDARSYTTLGREYGGTEKDTDGCGEQVQNGTLGRNQEAVITGWESERTVFFVHVGLKEYGEEAAQENHNSDVQRSYSDQFDIPGVVHLVGSFATLIENTRDNPNRKHYKLSKKEIAKRRAQGQQDGFVQSM